MTERKPGHVAKYRVSAVRRNLKGRRRNIRPERTANSCGLSHWRPAKSPGKLSANAFIEAFNSRFRQECLNERWFLTLDDAYTKSETWRGEYNSERPHSALDYQTPDEFILQLEQQGSSAA